MQTVKFAHPSPDPVPAYGVADFATYGYADPRAIIGHSPQNDKVAAMNLPANTGYTQKFRSLEEPLVFRECPSGEIIWRQRILQGSCGLLRAVF